MRLLALALALLLALGAAACGCDDDDDHAVLFSVIYDGPATSVEVIERFTGSGARNSTQTANDVVRIEIHGDYVRVQDAKGRVLLWHEPIHVSVRPHQLGPAPTPK